eukprot:GGOE01007981.1.p2 GENE.GGOE01007981.1~~GGOE01007981.1.p2  ORF type:complete len:126 (-),score=3.10 GGOE01007981.1:164-541(-)
MIFIIASAKRALVVHLPVSQNTRTCGAQINVQVWLFFMVLKMISVDIQWFQGYQQCFAVLAIHVVSGKCQEECNLSSNGESGPGAAVLFRLILWTGTVCGDPELSATRNKINPKLPNGMPSNLDR